MSTWTQFSVDPYIFIPLRIEIELENNEGRQSEDNVVGENDAHLWCKYV